MEVPTSGAEVPTEQAVRAVQDTGVSGDFRMLAPLQLSNQSTPTGKLDNAHFVLKMVYTSIAGCTVCTRYTRQRVPRLIFTVHVQVPCTSVIMVYKVPDTLTACTNNILRSTRYWCVSYLSFIPRLC